MSLKSTYIKAITRTFYINEIVPHISRLGRKVKKCIVLENGKEIYYSYSSERLPDSLIVNTCIDRFTIYLLEQNYRGEIVIYLNSQFVGFDTREDMGFFLGSSPNSSPQILLRFKYMNKQEIILVNELLRSVVKNEGTQ